MSGPRKFFNNRNQNRQTYDRINIKYVPPSRHAIFIRGLPNDIDTQKIKDFFQDATQSNVVVDFSSSNDEQRKLSVALRFESHDIAKDMLLKYNQTEIFGHRVEITWFKDLKKARDRMIDEKRNYDERMKSKYDRHDSGTGRRRIPYNNTSNNQSHDDTDRQHNYVSSDEEGIDDEEEERSRTSEDSINNHSVIHNKINTSKPSAYKVDLDEDEDGEDGEDDDDGLIRSSKDDDKMNYNATNQQPHHHHRNENNNDDKKKKKKKRKRKHNYSDSGESNNIISKQIKLNPLLESVESMSNLPTIAADSNNWKQTPSDSEDFLSKNALINKSRTFPLIGESDKLNNEKNLKLMKIKVESIEKAYKRDSETYASVVSVLIKKSPDMKNRLETLLKDVLVDLGNQCLDSMREYILHLSSSSTALSVDGSNNNSNNINTIMSNNTNENINDISLSPNSSI